MGKTSSMAMIAMKYAAKAEHMKDFVFTINLKHVHKETSLPELIVAEHCCLSHTNVAHIKAILEGKTQCKVALLLDDYQKYKRGTNKEIDEAIKSGIGNCLLILISCPGHIDKDIHLHMDGEVIMTGFSMETVQQCCSLYLESETDNLVDKLLQDATKTGFCNIDEGNPGLLSIPCILFMICGIYENQHSLPATQTNVVKEIIEHLMDRSTLKYFGCKSSELNHLCDLLYDLGEISWKALQRNVGHVFLPQVKPYGLIKKLKCNFLSITRNKQHDIQY